ncbi:unnamed protein product [Adineta steineri]|uniref:Glycosyltransferase 2-like domain-containing protein n=1 Tax=Adineta steineri TaxID=433720 RepID=A0A815JSS4_9BILA|nr:unnamed protein product [Adineta steineri]
MGNESVEEKFPLVDIIIVCCYEPSDILLDTVRSALALNYPKNKYRLWILDDGKDEFMEQYISKICVIYQRSPLVKYIRRFKEENKPHYYKAGNINNGLNEIKRYVGQLGDFILIQDVDMLIHPNFLLRTLPHIEENDQVAYIQIGQNLYNLNSSDILCQGLIGQNKLLLHCDSKNGSSTCIGSGMLIKSCVLDEINGIPPYSTTEDFNFSFSIHKLGYKSIYLDEALQFGLTPDSLIGTIEQYKRWESGNLQVVYRRFRELFSFNKQTNRMTFFQRFLYFTLGIRTKGFLFHIIYILIALAGIVYRLTRIRSNNLIQSLWYISLVSINIYSLIPPIWFIVFPPAIRKRKDLLLYTEQDENQEPTVKLVTNTSLYPTSKRTLLLLIFPGLLIVLAAEYNQREQRFKYVNIDQEVLINSFLENSYHFYSQIPSPITLNRSMNETTCTTVTNIPSKNFDDDPIISDEYQIDLNTNNEQSHTYLDDIQVLSLCNHFNNE